MVLYKPGGVEHEYACNMADAYARYIRLDDEPARQDLLSAMVQADQYAAEVRSSEDPQDTDTIHNGLVASAFILQHAIDDSPEPIITPEGDQFISLFDDAMEAFYSGELSYTERARLFDLAHQATSPLTTDTEQAQQAHTDFVSAVFGPDTEEARVYQEVDLMDLLKTASWLYGTSDEIVETRGWSIEPQGFFHDHIATLAAATQDNSARCLLAAAQKIVYGRKT